MPAKRYQITDSLRKQTTNVSNEQISSHITGNIRNAIQKQNPNAYDNFYNNITTREEIPLNSTMGRDDSDKTRKVSFNVAGSSFAQPLRYDLGLAGKTNLWLETGQGKQHIRRGDKNVKSYMFVNNNKAEVVRSEDVGKYASNETDEAFGLGGVLGKNDIREKITDEGKDIRYSLSGPRISLFGNKYNGTFNAGEYKIENTRKYILELGKRQINHMIDKGFFKDPESEVDLSFTGHSRGGVGTIEGAMLLKGWVKKEHPELLSKIHFNAMLYDPVPGPKSRVPSNINHGCNLKEVTKEMQELGMAPFDENDHTTVMYSMGCQHSMGFTPMKVLGADTIILTGHNHDEGLKDTEMQFGKRKTKAYVNAENGEAYRAMGLTRMPKGVFISDENNVLIKADSMHMVEGVISEVSELKMDNDRVRRVVEACTDVQVRNGGAPTMDTIVRGFNAHDPRYIRSSKEFRSMRADFEKFRKLMKDPEGNKKELDEVSDKLRKDAIDYLGIKEGNGPHSNRTQGRINIARNIIRMLDDRREKMLTGESADMKSDEKLDNAPKTEETMAAYHDNAAESFRKNVDSMKQLCERYQERKPVETDLFMQTISGMLADHYFLTHEKQLENKNTEQLGNMLGDGNESLYKTFSRSPAVKQYVGEILKEGPGNLFSDSKRIEDCMKYLTAQVEKEAQSKKQEKTVQAEKTVGNEIKKPEENTKSKHTGKVL